METVPAFRRRNLDAYQKTGYAASSPIRVGRAISTSKGTDERVNHPSYQRVPYTKNPRQAVRTVWLGYDGTRIARSERFEEDPAGRGHRSPADDLRNAAVEWWETRTIPLTLGWNWGMALGDGG